MIFVTLGTQDKGFPRLLKAIDREIKKGNIKEKVVVQAGCTEYKSPNMEIFDLIPADEFDKYIEKSDLVITHGGAGSILTAIKQNKKVIATPRLSKYKEHTNDHQKQIVEEFSQQGYILKLDDFSKLSEVIKKSKTFKPKKFESNTNNMIKLIEDYIEDSNHISWYNRIREKLLYLVFGFIATLINIGSFYLLREVNVSLYVSNILAWIITVLFAFITNKLYVFESKNKGIIKSLKEGSLFFVSRIISLVFDMGIMIVLVDVLSTNEMISKVIANIVVIIINYLFSKLIIFKK